MRHALNTSPPPSPHLAICSPGGRTPTYCPHNRVSPETCVETLKSVGNLKPALAERLRMEVARDMMTLAGRTSDTAFEENAPQFSSIPAVPFRLPDGTEVSKP